MYCPHPIENIMRTTMEQIREMVDVNTIVGDPIYDDNDTMILPVSKVSLGFISGGGEYGAGENIVSRQENIESVSDIRHPFAGSSAAGMSITPMAFMVVTNGNVKVIPAQYDNTIDRLIELVPRAIDEIGKLLGQVCEKSEEKSCKETENKHWRSKKKHAHDQDYEDYDQSYEDHDDETSELIPPAQDMPTQPPPSSEL